MAPPAIDGSTMRPAANSARAIRAMAPRRSAQGARLKNNHHKATSTPPANPCNPRIAIMDGRSWVKAQATEKAANKAALASI